jgi:hypothetical protein
MKQPISQPVKCPDLKSGTGTHDRPHCLPVRDRLLAAVNSASLDEQEAELINSAVMNARQESLIAELSA